VLARAAGANPVAKNWVLAIAQSIADRQPAAATRSSLERILADTAGDGEVRYWALDRLAERNRQARESLLDGREEDSSLDIRYEAIELAMSKLPSVDNAKNDAAVKQQTVAGYQKLLSAARLPTQINAIAAKLKELEVPVDLLKQFGFVSQWQLVGPFDNRNTIGFPVAYPPEATYAQTGKLDASQKFMGKSGEVSWQAASTDKPDGQIDLNTIYANEKGAVIYALATVQSPVDVACQVRLGSSNANKIWVNGQEITANNVYHAGSQIDQYVAPAQLRRGTNTVLLKLCQNEQTESWAQDYDFRFRFTDATGLAIPVTQ
jgi:hypothetical protein